MRSAGSANLVFPFNGPKGSAKVYVSAKKSSGKWQFARLVVEIDKTQARIDVLATNYLNSPDRPEGEN
ncbi:MAG: cytochrome c oxidase assembly factor Coa1 family protein [Limisphaerales bacterium]